MDVKKLRLEFLEKDPVCLVCGGRAKQVLLIADKVLSFCDTDCITHWHEARMDYICWKSREEQKEMIREMRTRRGLAREPVAHVCTRIPPS